MKERWAQYDEPHDSVLDVAERAAVDVPYVTSVLAATSITSSIAWWQMTGASCLARCTSPCLADPVLERIVARFTAEDWANIATDSRSLRPTSWQTSQFPWKALLAQPPAFGTTVLGRPVAPGVGEDDDAMDATRHGGGLGSISTITA